MRTKVSVVFAYVLLSGAAITSVSGRNNRVYDLMDLREINESQVSSHDQVSTIFESYDTSMSSTQVKDRLDALGLYMKEAPSFLAYIISYGGRRSCPGEALMRAQFAKDYLSKLKGINPQRIRILDGGFQDQWTVELWTGAKGAFAPTPMPTVDRRKVHIIRNCKLKSSGRKKHGS